MENCEMEKVVKSIQEYLNAGRKVDRKWGHSPALLINVEFSNRETMKKTKDPNKKCWVSAFFYLWNILDDKQRENQFCPPMEALSQEALLEHPHRKEKKRKKVDFWGDPIEISMCNTKAATICALNL